MLRKTSEATLLRSRCRASANRDEKRERDEGAKERERGEGIDREAAWIVAHFYEFFDLLCLGWIDVYFNTLSKQDEKAGRYVLLEYNNKEWEIKNGR